jgi:hypothetical protein
MQQTCTAWSLYCQRASCMTSWMHVKCRTRWDQPARNERSVAGVAGRGRRLLSGVCLLYRHQGRVLRWESTTWYLL